MNQLYEKKCDCKVYDDLDHRSALLHMELPECEDKRCDSTGYTICRALRFMGYITVVVLLSYALWRIHVIETTVNACDRLDDIKRLILETKNNVHSARVTRSLKLSSQIDKNSFGLGDKELSRGSMLTAKNENVPPSKKRPTNKDEFNELLYSLFDKIQIMHNDTDRSHFDNNMKAVFQAWLPVFDALLPREFATNGEVRDSRSAEKSSEGSSEEKKPEHEKEKLKRSVESSVKSSEESSEEKKERLRRSAEKSSEESSEEKKQKLGKSTEKSSGKPSEDAIPRFGRSAEKSSEESSEEKKPENAQEKSKRSVGKSSEESSEEKKQRFGRSVDKSSEESSEEKKQRYGRSIGKNSGESSEEKKEKLEKAAEKNSEESSEEKNVRFGRSTEKSSEKSSEEKKPV